MSISRFLNKKKYTPELDSNVTIVLDSKSLYHGTQISPDSGLQISKKSEYVPERLFGLREYIHAMDAIQYNR